MEENTVNPEVNGEATPSAEVAPETPATETPAEVTPETPVSEESTASSEGLG